MDDRPLSPVYLDNQPVEIEDSKPRVAQVVAAGRKREGVRVVRLTSRLDMEGSPLGPDDVIDRTEVTPVYLKTFDSRPPPASDPGSPGPRAPGPHPEPPRPPPPIPDPEPQPTPPDPLPPDPTLRDVEHPPADPAEGQVE